ncbi:uridine kinase [Saccharopolyspora sp. NFXS83]|uniref:uridine kinase n=1 Tax=Saccharopolyspora sp. NFXS83 TaxID=2993560 RepID=UPI00224B51B5|nr:uridine kinase [Saccharopolyspora sp. NFXS83]MCX2734113.1 uridine kinase [Saccharopolyspora sp. NFXS83]
MRVRAITPEKLTDELADVIDGERRRWVRVAVDGAEAAGTAGFADELVQPLRVRGHEVVRVRMDGYVRPASLRFEHGRDDPDSFYESWFDLAGLRREVLDPLADGGTGEVLPALWDAATDRSPRLDRVRLPQRGVVLVDGPLLLGAGLPFDRTVHLWLPGGSLARRTAEADRWTLPAFDRYSTEVAPERLADHVIRVDRPGHPAVVDEVA